MNLLREDADLRCAAHGNVLIGWWRRRVSYEAVCWAEEEIERLIAQHPRGIIEFVFMSEGVALPDKAARDHMVRYVRRLEKHFVAMVLVYEGTGPLAIAVRAAARAITSLARAVVPLAVVASSEEGVAWLVRHGFVPSAEAPALLAAVQEARSAP